MMKVLHAGCGRMPLPEWMPTCQEVRLDIDPAVSPDVVAPLTDFGDISGFHLAYCCHALEHLTPSEITKSLSEFHRVLVEGGAVVIIVPNLDGIKPDNTVYYESSAGPITGLDMYYGKESMVEENPYMAHKYGFVESTLRGFMERAGFKIKEVKTENFNLCMVGLK